MMSCQKIIQVFYRVTLKTPMQNEKGVEHWLQMVNVTKSLGLCGDASDSVLTLERSSTFQARA